MYQWFTEHKKTTIGIATTALGLFGAALNEAGRELGSYTSERYNYQPHPIKSFGVSSNITGPHQKVTGNIQYLPKKPEWLFCLVWGHSG